MRRIVCNATPLIYLAKVGKLELLRQIFGEILIPEEVKAEVIDRGKMLGEKDAYAVEKAVNDGWLKVARAKPLKTLIKLEDGETAALSLAKKLNIREILMDERPARSAATLLDLTPRGTVFVLLKALEKRILNLDEFLSVLGRLIEHGFRLKEEVYVEAVGKAREIAEKEIDRQRSLRK